MLFNIFFIGLSQQKLSMDRNRASGQPYPYVEVQLTNSRYFNTPPRNLSHFYEPELYANRSHALSRDNSFEFGKQQDNLASRVMNHLKSNESNNKILEKFRLDAVRRKNSNFNRKKGSVAYITQSMVPGANIDPNQYLPPPKFQPQQKKRLLYPPINPPAHYYQNYKTLQPPPLEQPIDREVYPSPLPNKKKSVGVQANFQRQFPMKSHSKKKKKQKLAYTIEDSQQHCAFNKINTMLDQLNNKLKFSTQILVNNQKQVIESSMKPKKQQQEQKHRKFTYRRFLTEEKNPQSLPKPSIQYNTANLRLKSENSNNKSTIKDHLKLLKKNKKRLEDLDAYIYQC